MSLMQGCRRWKSQLVGTAMAGGICEVKPLSCKNMTTFAGWACRIFRLYIL